MPNYVFQTFYGPAWLFGLTNEVEQLRLGNSVIIGGGVYRVCHKCKNVVKLNKIFFGSLHTCE